MTHRITLNNVRTRISKTVFLARAVGGCAALVAFLFAGEMHAANILTNSGFETASLAGWTPFGANNYSQSGAALPMAESTITKFTVSSTARLITRAFIRTIPRLRAPSTRLTAGPIHFRVITFTGRTRSGLK